MPLARERIDQEGIEHRADDRAVDEVEECVVEAAPVAQPAPLRVVIYRRLMLRIAERLAGWQGATALVTGDAIGQVASQTLDNLVAVGAAATMPVFRPLVGMDKDEVVADARRLGTYPISILPDEDCCRLFVPAHPSTRATRAEAEAAEALLPLGDLVEHAVQHTVVERISPTYSSR